MTSVHVKLVITNVNVYTVYEKTSTEILSASLRNLRSTLFRTNDRAFSSVWLHHTHLCFRKTVTTTMFSFFLRFSFSFFLRFLFSFSFSIQFSHDQQTRNSLRVQERLQRRLSLTNFKTFSESVQINIRLTRLLSFV